LSTPLMDAAQNGKQISTVSAGEGVELLEESSDSNSGFAKVKVEKDGSVAWVEWGTSKPNFKESSGISKLDSIEAHVVGVHRACKQAVEYFDRKAVEVASVKQGPLADVKAKLLNLRNAVGQEQAKIEQLRQRVSSARTEVSAMQKEEVQKVQEARIKAIADKSVAEAKAVVTEAEQISEEAMVMTASAGSVEKLVEMGINKLESLKTSADKALQALSEARGKVGQVSASLEARKGSSRATLLEARVELTKLGTNTGTLEKKLWASTEAVRVAHSQVAKEVIGKARDALRASALASGQTSDALFAQVAGDKAEMTADEFGKLVGSLPNHKLTPDQVSLVYREIGSHGLRKSGFAKAIQDFRRCTKVVAITETLDIESKQVRKLGLGELFEIYEGPKEDLETKVQRVRGRALKDGTEGWVAVENAQGTTYLKSIEKPFVWCSATTDLMSSSSGSKQIRQLAKGEVCELLQGPFEETPDPELIMQCAASKDGVSGWITLRDTAGHHIAKPSKGLYVCKSAIAMTDVLDIKDCQVVRKVDVGETLEAVGETEEDSTMDISRLKFRSPKDGKTGWVTLRGNQGTIFVEPSMSHYVLSSDACMRLAPARGSAMVRELHKGETLEVLEPPKEDRPDPRILAKVRALEDADAGWVCWAKGSKRPPLRPWTSKYVCKSKTDISSTFEAGSGSLKSAEPGEVLECLDGPFFVKETGVRRVMLVGHDGIVGWASLNGSDGSPLLEPAS